MKGLKSFKFYKLLLIINFLEFKKKSKHWRQFWWMIFRFLTTTSEFIWFIPNNKIKCWLLLFRGNPELVKSTIFPSTAHDTEKQYVCVTLEVTLPEQYPDCEPIVQLRNPRGLDDTNLNYLSRAIKDKCNEYIGQSVIYELIEVRTKWVCSNKHYKLIGFLVNKGKFNGE